MALRGLVLALGYLLAVGIVYNLLRLFDVVPKFTFPVVVAVLLLAGVLAFATLMLEDPRLVGRGTRLGPDERFLAWFRERRPLGSRMWPTGYLEPRPEARESTALARLRYRVPDGTPLEDLRRAASASLEAATRALPGRGRVKASADFEDERGPFSVVSIRLRVTGAGADAAWAAAAAEAFSREYERRLRARGVASAPA